MSGYRHARTPRRDDVLATLDRAIAATDGEPRSALEYLTRKRYRAQLLDLRRRYVGRELTATAALGQLHWLQLHRDESPPPEGTP